MKKILLFILSVLFSVNVYTQSCTSTVYYDNMETFTWFGDWYLYNFSNFYTNFSVSPSASAVHYGSGNGSSGIEQDWYVLPEITGLNPNYTYKVRFKLASFTATAPSAGTRGLDGTDYLQVQLSRNGGAYVNEMRILGFSNQTWNFSATGVAAKTANGTNTNYQIRTGGVRTDAYSTIELTLQPNTTSVAVDLYVRCNSAGEEFWIDNIELIETIPTPNPGIFGDSIVCAGDTITLTAVGGDVFSWSGGISNGVSFVPSVTNNYVLTTTFNGMINGDGLFNTCTSTQNKLVMVDENCALPINLISFNGTNKGEYNNLNWVTDNEINFSHFILEKSNDGFNFEPLTEIPSNGLNNRSYYTTNDYNPYQITYYRLKSVDSDGSYEYSNIVVIERKGDINNGILYPNPTSDVINYGFTSEENEILEIKVLDMVGKVVIRNEVELNVGNNKIPINLTELISGNYTIVIKHTNSGVTKTSKVIKI